MTSALGAADDSAERTILTTDIVGSTAMIHRHPDDIVAAMDQHDHILAAAIARHHGQSFKNTGDGIFAIFARPSDAVQVAIEIQRDMRDAAWGPTGRLLIRCGIHTGLVRARGADYFGPALPTAARLQSAASGDQILVSAATATLIAPTVSAGLCEFMDLGEHHFKGIEPVRVLQVCAAGLPAVFPPIAGKRETAGGNLPANLTSFLGREAELRELLQITRGSRMITLVGPGGIGKTRLAVEFARLLEPSFPDGAWLVDLASLDRGSDVWPAIAVALLIEAVPGLPRRAQVLERLRDAQAILLMDNCEHVLVQMGDVVVELGAACGSLCLINTSRRSLGVDGEAVYEVPPLGSAAAALRLFVERGRLSDHRFSPSADDLSVITTICDHLEHIPLAIEIAARNLRRLTLAEIAQAVTQPLDLHAARSTRRGGRQLTLRHTLEWSFDLLDEAAQQVWLRLSVFSGPFREDQALEVCAADMPHKQQVLDGIDTLLESSLLSRDPSGSRRLRMLQTVQGFGRAKLAEAGRLDAVDRRYCEVFAARARLLADRFAQDSEARAANAVYDDMPNLRSAFERSMARDLNLAAEIAEPLFLFNYFHRGAETGDWYRRIMAGPEADALKQAPIILAGAAVYALHNTGDPKQASAFIERGLAAEAAGAQSSRGWLSAVSGQVELWTGRAAQCVACHATAIDQARAAGNVPCEVTSLCTAAFVMARQGNLAGAEALVEEIRHVETVVKQPSLLGYIAYAIGGVESFTDPAKAVEQYQRSADWATMGGNHLGALRVKHLIADLQAENAKPPEAAAIHIRTLVNLPPHGATFYAWSTIRALLSPLAALGAYDDIAVIAGAIQASPVKLDRAARLAIGQARTALGETRFDHGAKRGAGLRLPAIRLYIERELKVVAATGDQTVAVRALV
jgi:predicted ATPase/class 3 adenylate cyclase